MTSPATDDTNPKDRLGVKKAPLFFVPWSAVVQMALAFAEGARKYGAFNWRRKKVRRSIYLEAILRHAIALTAGEDIDPDSGLPHEAKIMACAAIMIDAQRGGCLVDDRFEGDTTAALLAELTAGDYHATAAALTRTPARTLDEVRAEGVSERRETSSVAEAGATVVSNVRISATSPAAARRLASGLRKAGKRGLKVNGTHQP